MDLPVHLKFPDANNEAPPKHIAKNLRRRKRTGKIRLRANTIKIDHKATKMY
jgi:hypothetical protein